MNAAAQHIDISTMMRKLGEGARAAAGILARAGTEQKNQALEAAASQIIDRSAAIVDANGRDMEVGRGKQLSDAMLDRLSLDESRVTGIADGLKAIAALDDPVGTVAKEWTRPNGLRIQRVLVPLGVIGVIYESRPNVTSDAGALCLKSGNAVILRGGSESFFSSTVIHECLVAGLSAAKLPEAAIQMVPTTSRDAVGYMLSEMQQYIDVIVPRGGKNLIARVQADARIPVIGHLEGLCHIYVHGSSEPDMAREIVLNAKMRRTGICGSAETLLIDRDVLESHWASIADALVDSGCEIRGDEEICSIDSRVSAANESDWTTEYLDAIISVKAIGGIDEAVDHITRYGSGHTECIVATDENVVSQFFHDIDSAILLHNASTQYADGAEFGMGAEIGIATGRVHARGPVGVEQLTSYKYLVHGSGQTRP